MPPLVTLCIPTYNSERWIAESLGSALAQDYPELEILVLDNASTDATVERVRELGGSRVRIEVNERNVGAVRNFNRAARAARGEYVKFLMSDDVLYPTCVSEMAALMEAHPEMGLVFSTRDVLLQDPTNPAAQQWRDRYRYLHHEWERLERVNPPGELFRQYLRCGFRVNWVGEPTCVLVRRAAFERLGYFNSRLYQGVDFEMWARVMYYYGAGFIDRDLSAFRYHVSSSSSSNHLTNRPWLDMLWLIEGLLRHPEIRRDYPQISRLRYKESARIVRALYRRAKEGLWPDVGEHLRSLGAYLDYRVRRWYHAEPDIHRDFG